MCGCEFCISAKIIHSSLLSWRDRYLRKLKISSQNSQNRRSGEKSNCLFGTYKNSVMPHWRHIYATAYAMVMDTMCAYPPSQHTLPQWKCVLHYCSTFPRIDLPDQWSGKYYSNAYPSVGFNIYHLISRFTLHGRRPLNEIKCFRLCFQDPATVTPAKLYSIYCWIPHKFLYSRNTKAHI